MDQNNPSLYIVLSEIRDHLHSIANSLDHIDSQIHNISDSLQDMTSGDGVQIRTTPDR
jgi:hypothetical protein